MAPKPPSPDDQNPASADDPELAKKLALEAASAGPVAGAKVTGAAGDDDDKDEDDDELELDDDDDEDLVVFTAKEAAGACVGSSDEGGLGAIKPTDAARPA